MYRSQRFVERVTGQLLCADTRRPIARAWVMPLASATWSEEARTLSGLRAASQLNVVSRFSGTTTREGSFELLGSAVWRGDIEGRSRSSHGIGALLIEIPGAEPQIVELPAHPSDPALDEYELLATYDLGSIEVARTAVRAAMLVA